MPVFVALLLNEPDPVVGNSHSHAVVEPDAAVFEWDGEAGHAAHLFGNRDCARVDLMDKQVGQSQICYGVGVLTAVVIVVV